jgi:hypothetical protein
MTYRFRNDTYPTYKMARRLVPLVINMIGTPHSVVDLGGGGGGGWCRAFKENGTTQVWCIEHPSIVISDLLIDERELIRCDFENDFPAPIKSDLAVSIEVAEHLSQSKSDTVVDFLTQSAPVVLFSAAIPGQGGDGHINEQRPAFWRNLFERKGFHLVDAIRPKILFDRDIASWIRQNLYLYVCQEYLSKLPFTTESYMFIPDEFELVETRILSRDLSLSQVLKNLPGALRRALAARF